MQRSTIYSKNLDRTIENSETAITPKKKVSEKKFIAYIFKIVI